ncbi:MAG: VOC family protein, partial [Deltaproteobacteria bacterium]|nr:VOC family protein [Deltaproteobacteria bacterium]
PLVALYDMHGVPGAWHAFVRLDDLTYLAFAQVPGVEHVPSTVGLTHAGTGAGFSAPGTMQHVAFRVADEDELLALRDRLRSNGIVVMGPIDHGMCLSIYFAGPDQMTLEVATSGAALDPAQWIDPAVLAKAGISPQEAARFTAPAPYQGPSPVPQPQYDAAKPHMVYPPEIYQQILATPDEVMTARFSYTQPPVTTEH